MLALVGVSNAADSLALRGVTAGAGTRDFVMSFKADLISRLLAYGGK